MVGSMDALKLWLKVFLKFLRKPQEPRLLCVHKVFNTKHKYWEWWAPGKAKALF